MSAVIDLVFDFLGAIMDDFFVRRTVRAERRKGDA